MNDFFRSFLCISFPPNEIAASSLYMSLLFLKINLSMDNVSIKTSSSSDKNDTSSSIKAFPWKLLFNAELINIQNIARLSYEFLKIIKK